MVGRDAACIVLLDPSGRVLLQEITETGFGGSVWITPGGGVDEIEAAAGITFAPRLFGLYLRPLINGVIPTEPIDVGV
jgi:hypothetical protein